MPILKQRQEILFMETKHALTRTIEKLIEQGFEITSVVRLREFRYPNMGVEPVTDWLIIYKDVLSN